MMMTLTMMMKMMIMKLILLMMTRMPGVSSKLKVVVGGCSDDDVDCNGNDQVHILQGAQVLGCPVAIHTHLQPKIREAR